MISGGRNFTVQLGVYLVLSSSVSVSGDDDDGDDDDDPNDDDGSGTRYPSHGYLPTSRYFVDGVAG